MDDSQETNSRRDFETLLLPLLRSLHNLALKLTRRPEDARDLVQETCLRAYRTFANFTPGTNSRAWLFTILYSIFSNRTRRARREPETLPGQELDLRFDQSVAGWSGTGPAGVEDASIGEQVQLALGRLSESFRSALLLVDVEELSYEEAAHILGCPIGTLRSRLFRARQQLFVELRPYARSLRYPGAETKVAQG